MNFMYCQSQGETSGDKAGESSRCEIHHALKFYVPSSSQDQIFTLFKYRHDEDHGNILCCKSLMNRSRAPCFSHCLHEHGNLPTSVGRLALA
uniref:Uncharacterized protein n=1 Tax=Triticum urartu TaxID=4572 RepID=A0A8R7QMN7_TRIUA